MSNLIAAIDAGTSYHHVALNDERWAHMIDERWYLPDLDQYDFSHVDVIIATCRSNPDLLSPHKVRFQEFLDEGGTIVAFAGTDPAQWLPNIESKSVSTNYWWWLEADPQSELEIASPKHPLFDALSLTEMTWHHHTRFIPPEGAVSLINHNDGSSVFYEDKISTRGRLLITGLDPFFHHGSYFMPATTRFLEKFLPWLNDSSEV
ncbi:MAG: hypothetical protein COB23_03285 [Methylophaga sp.]|nr:MAG: hypothetical protein COB23_03285 [Methylophaga sp.]